MKVLVISGVFPPMRAGEADHAFHLCHQLGACGLDVHVLTGKNNAPTGDFPFQVHSVMRDWSWADLPRMAKFMRRLSPDAILLMYSGGPIYSTHPMITFAPTLSKILLPQAVFVTQFEIEFGTIGASLFTRGVIKLLSKCSKSVDYVFGTLLSASDRIIVLSERHRRRLLERSQTLLDKIEAIPPPPLLRVCAESNGAGRRRGREALGIETDDFVIGHLGYLYSAKGVETLFEAFRIISRRRRNVRLVMIGGKTESPDLISYSAQLSGLPKRLGIDDRVIWTGEYACDSDEGSLYLRAADACAFPFVEGVTLNRSSVAAAAAHGVPIITTRGENMEPAFLDRGNVLLCAPRDPNSLAEALDSLIQDGELRRCLSAGALQLAAECFSWDKAVERTIKALQDSERKEERNWLGMMAVWLSGISMLVYFVSSHGVKNHMLFLVQSFRKVVEKTGAGF